MAKPPSTLDDVLYGIEMVSRRVENLMDNDSAKSIETLDIRVVNILQILAELTVELKTFVEVMRR